MTKMIELVEEMRARLNQSAESEHALVRALGEALSRVDQKLLQDVRNMTVDHESRRGAILHELQTLATRIGAFPTQREQVPGVEFGNPTSKPIAAANGNQLPFNRGDWRQAANNIEDELDIYFQDRVVASR
jgi:hypothetical protein